MAVIDFNIYSGELGMKTDVTIILPFYPVSDVTEEIPDMFPNGRKYQVLWLLHGGNGNDRDYIEKTNIVNYAEEHMLAVVMPSGYNMNYDDQEGEMKMRMCTFIGEELPDVLRSLFPFSDRREDNFIGGLSMGSNGAQKVAIRYPEQYAAVLAMSAGSFNVRPKASAAAVASATAKAHPAAAAGMPRPYHKPDEMEENCEILKRDIADGKKLPKFFMVWGEKDFARTGSIASAKFLKEQGLEVYEEEVPGVGHEWALWDPYLKKAFNELLPLKNDLISL